MPGATPLRESACRVLKTEGFLRFFNFWSNPLLRPFFRERKNEWKSPKNVNKWVFWRFFMFEATLCGNPAVECQELRVFCNFAVPESVLTICFALYGLLQTLSRGEKRWFQTSLKPVWNRPDGFRLVSDYSETHLFWKRKLRNGRMIRFESYGGWKLPQIGPDDLFFYTRPLQGHPEPSSDGFRGVSEWFQGFQSGFKGVWNRVVLEWFQRVWNRVVSEWFQRVWNRVVSEWF